jgi:hypothetical protein
VVKEYGKLSTDQFRRLIGKLPKIWKSTKELQDELRNATPEKIRAVLTLPPAGGYSGREYAIPF